MKNISISKTGRIFQVDNECYIIFLGEHPDDVKPFLRIGNTSWLPAEVQRQVDTVVMTESYTGNPLKEVELSKDFDGQYLGDPFVVEGVKRFFSSLNIDNGQVKDYNQVEKRDGRDMVYFFSNGNLILQFQGSNLFDLLTRERKDRHYPQRCQEQKIRFSRNPLQYSPEHFSGRGFFLTEDDFFLSDQGSLFGLRMTPDYFENLCAAGLDADRVSGALIKLSLENLAEDSGETFVRLLKRSKKEKYSIEVFTFDNSAKKTLEKLFPDSESLPSHLNLVNVKSKKSFMWRNYKLNLEEGRYRFSLDGHEYLWAKGGQELWVENGSVAIQSPLLKGIPYQMISQELDASQIFHKFVEATGLDLYKQSRGGIARGVFEEVLKELQQFFQIYIEGKEEKVVEACAKLNQSIDKIPLSEYAYYYLHNLSSFAEFLQKENKNKEIQSALVELQTRIGALLERSGIPDSRMFPAQGFLLNHRHFFYRPLKMSVNRIDRERALTLSTEIAKLSETEEGFYAEERQRLQDVIAGLQDGSVLIQNGTESMADQLKERAAKDREKRAREEAARPKKKTDATQIRSERSIENKTTVRDAEKKQTPSPLNSVKKKPPQESRRLWWIPAILLLLLIFLLPFSPLSISNPDSMLRAIITGDSGRDIVYTSDTGSSDSGSSDSGSSDTGSSDTGSSDSGSSDSGSSDTGSSDTGSSDSGSSDSGSSDTGSSDSGRSDSGRSDSGRSDSGRSDSGRSDSGRSDSGRSDSGSILQGTVTDGSDAEIFYNESEFFQDGPMIIDAAFVENFQVDGVRITLADIHLRANGIAVKNGFRDLGFHEVTGADPTFIFPGNKLEIPDFGDYVIQPDDNIWFIAAMLLEKELRISMNEFDKIKAEWESADEEQRRKLEEEVNNLRLRSNCENFSVVVKNWLNELR